jgi:hypothetical protein
MSTDRGQKWSIWKFVLILEWIALLIGLAMPITPSKTGSDFSMADWFFQEPSYLQEVLVYFLLSNLLLGILALIALVIIYFEKRRAV